MQPKAKISPQTTCFFMQTRMKKSVDDATKKEDAEKTNKQHTFFLSTIYTSHIPDSNKVLTETTHFKFA
jgi:hypothetical protein